MMWASWGLIALAAAASVSAQEGSAAFSPPYYPSPWASGQGDWEDAVTRARAIVSQMTLPEKVNLTTGVGWMQEDCVGNVGSIPRLGIASLCLQDGPLGVRLADYVTAFPAGINVGATFSKDLAYLRGKAMGEEQRDKGVDVLLGPVAGPLGRSPDGGRNWEGFSPDPVNTGLLIAETIRGIQEAGVIATAKHFIAQEQERFRVAGEGENGVDESASSNVDDVTMHELYLWPFVDAVRAGVGAVMCSYQQINNSYACQNGYTQNRLLKGELGFQGFIMSDWQAQHVGVGAALAGLDMSMPGDTTFGTGRSYWGANMTIAVANGTLPEWRLDDMAVRIMAAYYRVGRDRFARPSNFNSWTRDELGFQHAMVNERFGVVNERVNVRGQHHLVARQVASASTVLLKNEGVLPLTGHEKFTGVIGEDAGPNPKGPNGCPDRGCADGTLAMGWGSGTADFPYLVTPAEAIQREVLSVGNGNVAAVFDNTAAAQIQLVASQATVALVFVNAGAGEGYISVDGNSDRLNLTVWGDGDTLIRNVTSYCNNTIVVVHSGGPVLVNEWKENPNVTAILWAGLPGQESGNALADVLYGRVNPGGKSPFTWGTSREDYGAPILWDANRGTQAPQIDFEEGIFIDYRAFDRNNIEPEYEFGFGLSYTTFSYANLVVERADAGPYVPTRGRAGPPPRLGHSSRDLAQYQFPEGWERIPLYIYPWVNSTNARESSGDRNYGMNSSAYLPPGATHGGPRELLGAGGGPGGNPRLFDVLYRVSATITNTGPVAGDEVPQLYVSLGGENNARVVLRNFDRIHLAPGESKVWTTALTRRDLSNWDPVRQNWFINEHPKTVYVGSSSRKLHLNAELPR